MAKQGCNVLLPHILFLSVANHFKLTHSHLFY